MPNLKNIRVLLQWLDLWFSDELGCAGLTVGFNDLKGLSQPEVFYDSVISWYLVHVQWHVAVCSCFWQEHEMS